MELFSPAHRNYSVLPNDEGIYGFGRDNDRGLLEPAGLPCCGMRETSDVFQIRANKGYSKYGTDGKVTPICHPRCLSLRNERDLRFAVTYWY